MNGSSVLFFFGILFTLFYFIGSVYVVKKYDGFRLFYHGLSRWVDYKGRASRIEYASIVLLVVSVDVVISIIFSMLNNPPQIFLEFMNGMFMLATLSVTARRLHDFGYSGWLQVPILIIRFYTDVNLMSQHNNYISTIILLLIMLSFDLLLMFKDGQSTPNKYGEKPAETISGQLKK